jgi:hypothetical protein
VVSGPLGARAASYYGLRKLVDLIEATQLFEIDRRGPHVAVRDKRRAKASSR